MYDTGAQDFVPLYLLQTDNRTQHKQAADQGPWQTDARSLTLLMLLVCVKRIFLRVGGRVASSSSSGGGRTMRTVVDLLPQRLYLLDEPCLTLEEARVAFPELPKFLGQLTIYKTSRQTH